MIHTGDQVNRVRDPRYLFQGFEIPDITLLYLQDERRHIGAAEVFGILLMDFDVRMVLREEVKKDGKHLNTEDHREKEERDEEHGPHHDFSESYQECDKRSIHGGLLRSSSAYDLGPKDMPRRAHCVP